MSRHDRHTHRPTRRQRQRAGRPLGPPSGDWYDAMRADREARAQARDARQLEALFDVPSLGGGR